MLGADKKRPPNVRTGFQAHRRHPPPGQEGCSTELDYIEQTSWLLFLKYLDALEDDRAQIAELHGQPHAFLLEKRFRWHAWAMPLHPFGALDHNRALVGDDLRDFVDQKLFPYLRGFKQRADSPDTIEYKIGEIFAELRNKLQSGYNLREDGRGHRLAALQLADGEA